MPRGTPIGEITHWRNENAEDLPRQPDYTNPCLWRNPNKGDGVRPPPLVDSFIWVSPWLWVRVFGLPGEVFHIFITPMCDFSYGIPTGPKSMIITGPQM